MKLDTGSLALRLAAGFVLSFLMLAAGVGALQLLLTERFGGYATRQSMQGQLEDIVGALEFDAQGRVSGVRLDGIDAEAYDAFFANLKFRVLDADGQVVASSEADRRSMLPDVPLAMQADFYEERKLGGASFHVGAWRTTARDQELTVQLGRSDRFADLAQEALSPVVTETIGLVAALAAVVFALVGAWVVRSTLKPIEHVVGAARIVGDPRLDARLLARLPDDGMPAEIRPLIASFNAVLSRLQATFEQQQRFFANAAHELKTPIALLRSRLDDPALAAADAPARADTLRDIDALGRTVQQLLQLAEIGARPPTLRPTDIGAAVEDAVRYLSWSAEQRQVALRLRMPATAIVQPADAGALFALAKNLIDNAIDFSPRGSIVAIELDGTLFSVQDSGPGIPPDDRERVFERFWRAAGQARGGAGLGLAIARDIALAHGWRLECVDPLPLQAAAVARGARFELRFG